MMRYLRAFFKALQLTIQGKQFQPVDVQYPSLTQWIHEGRQLVNEAYKLAESNGWSEEKRQSLRLTLDRRDISMEVILGSVRHNLTMEYPKLLESRMQYNLTALYALNMNDQYRVAQLAQEEELPKNMLQSVQALADHLAQIPPSNQP
ncbi:MAG: hypothetical protein KC496_04920 [Anaerolineae bacterium]|nr:hypothetical protein [Anaerolineae bacterium]